MRILIQLGLCIGLLALGYQSCKKATAEVPPLFGSFDWISDEWKVDTTRIQTIEIPNQEEPSFLLSEIADSSWSIPLQTNKESIIGKIDKIEIHQGVIYVLDITKAKRLLAFNLRGEFLYQIGERGKAVGRYAQPEDFVLNKTRQEIIIYDDQQHKFLYYDLQGKYQKEEPINFLLYGLAAQEENGYLLNSFGRTNPLTSGPSFRLLHKNTQGQITSKILPYDKKIEQFPFRVNRFEFSTYGSELLYSPNFLGEIYSIQAKEISLKYRLGQGANALPQAYYKKNPSDFMESYNQEKKGQHLFFTGPFFETQQHLIFYLANKQHHYAGIYQKSTQKLKYGKLIDNLPNSLNLHLIHSIHDGKYLVASIDSYHLVQEKERIPFWKNKSSEAKRMLDQLSPADNPVLSFYRLKSM